MRTATYLVLAAALAAGEAGAQQADTLHFHYPSFQAESTGTCREDFSRPVHLSLGLLYSRASTLPVRSHVATPGAADTFIVPLVPMEWAVVSVNAWGRPGCWAWHQVGSPQVSVAPQLEPWPAEGEARWYDISGRRERVLTTRHGRLEPVARGTYVERVGERARVITIGP